MKVENLPKIKLGAYPTPLEKMSRLSALFGKGDLFIKRDDLTGPALGGNKTRKLEYLLQDAVSQGCTAVLTVGGPQTNHGRATAAAAINLGLKPILVLSGNKPEYLSGNLTLDAMMGVDIIFDNCHMEEAVKTAVEHYENQGEKVYFIPMGGSDHIGTLGYIMAVPELMRQIEELGIGAKYLVCSSGSMGTYAGLNLGARYFGAAFKVIGIPTKPLEDSYVIQAADFINQISARYDMGVTVRADELLIRNGPADKPYSGAAYNEPDPLTRKYIYMMAKTQGIILDPTYTGKSFRGFCEMLETGEIEAGSEPIYLHTGGMAAVWTKEHLDAMQGELFDNCRITAYTPKI